MPQKKYGGSIIDEMIIKGQKTAHSISSYGKAKNLTIELEGKTANINIANASSSCDLKIAQIKKGSYLELKIVLKELGLTNIMDYGEKIAAKVMPDGVTFDGTFILTSIQWFATDNPAHRYVKREDSMDVEDPLLELQDNSTESTPDYVYAGWYTNDDDYYMYDIYGGADSKAAIVTAMAFVNSKLAGTEVFAPMEKSGEVSLYTEFDIQLLSMPIYKGGVTEENKVGFHSFKINISNMAMGYYYGKCMVDNITFNDIRDENINSEAITMDLNLMSEYANPQLSSGKLTWSSTGTAVAPDGTATRPEDKSYDLNRLIVTNELGHSKEIITAVKGFKKLDDMFFLRDDYDTYHGVGQKYVGGAFFDFDMENTSVIKV